MFSQKNMIKARKELLIVGQNAVSLVVTWSARYMLKRNLPPPVYCAGVCTRLLLTSSWVATARCLVNNRAIEQAALARQQPLAGDSFVKAESIRRKNKLGRDWETVTRGIILESIRENQSICRERRQLRQN